MGPQPVQDPQALTHRLDARADSLERQRLPCREVEHPVGAEDRSGVGGEAFGFGLGRRADQDGPTIGRRDEARENQGAAGIADRDDRLAPPERGIDRRLVAEPVEQVAERRTGVRGTSG